MKYKFIIFSPWLQAQNSSASASHMQDTCAPSGDYTALMEEHAETALAPRDVHWPNRLTDHVT